MIKLNNQDKIQSLLNDNANRFDRLISIDTFDKNIKDVLIRILQNNRKVNELIESETKYFNYNKE